MRENHLARVMPRVSVRASIDPSTPQRGRWTGRLLPRKPAAHHAQEDTVTLGPLEYVVVGFEGNHFDGSIAHEIAKVVENKTIRLVDVVFLMKDTAGDVAIVEIDNKDDPRFASFAPLLGDSVGLFTPEDVESIALGLRPDTAALVLLFEHHWAVDIKEAMQAAGGFLVGRATIAPEVLEELNDELEAHIAARIA
jgi:hypothetical protein